MNERINELLDKCGWVKQQTGERTKTICVKVKE